MEIYQIANPCSVKHSIYRVCDIYGNLIYNNNFVEFDEIDFPLFCKIVSGVLELWLWINKIGAQIIGPGKNILIQRTVPIIRNINNAIAWNLISTYIISNTLMLASGARSVETEYATRLVHTVIHI